MSSESPKSEKEELLELAHYSGDPWTPENPYFDHAQKFMKESWEGLIAKILEPVLIEGALSNIVDLAAGHGRNSEYLHPYSASMYLLDIQEGNIEVCKNRFSKFHNFSYAVNNGYDLQPVPDSWADLVYCFDAMVHFDSDVIRSYLRDSLRVLKPGAYAFLHHSNYTGGRDWKTNPNARNFMSAEFFAHFAYKEGLVVVSQKIIPWAGYENIDCVTLLQKPL